MHIDEGWEQGVFNPSVTTYADIGSERRFGVELEYNDLPEDVFDLEDETCFGAKEDCTVDGGEFDSPILYGDQGLGVVKYFCNMADENNFEVGRCAGYHLHLDMTDETVDTLKKLALAYHYTHKLWVGMVPANRRDFTYSRPHSYTRGHVLNWDDLSDFRNALSRLDRYSWVNWTAYYQHKTVEIRCHESTTDAKTVTNWIIAHTRFCDAMKDSSVGRITRHLGNKKPADLLRELRSIIQCPDVSGHLSDRYKQFNV